MARTSLDNRPDQDTEYNPGELHAAEQFSSPYSQAGVDQLESHANDPKNHADATDGDGNTDGIDDAREKEKSGGWATKVTGAAKQVVKARTTVLNKKNGLIMGLLILLIGGAGFSITIIPGLSIVHMKETLMDNLDDQMSALDRRSVYVAKSKLQAGGSICSDTINIRCKFSTMSNSRIAKMKANGFTIIEGDSKLPGRSKVSEMSYTDKSGKVHKISDPGKLQNLLFQNQDARKSMRTVYNTRFENYAGKAFASVKNKIPGINKQQKIPETSDKAAINKAIQSAAQGRPLTVDSGGAVVDGDDENAEKTKGSSGKLEEEAEKVRESGKKASSSLLKGGARGVGILGPLDSACVVKNTMIAVEVGAKVIRARQLANFAMLFLTTADAIKAGDAKPKQVEAIGNILTATDDREMVEFTDDTGKTVKEKNPYYKKSAFDSVGYKMAAYGDKPYHTMNTIPYLIGGTPALGSLSGLNGALKNLSPLCKVVTNPVTRIVSGVIGIVAAVGSFGTLTVITVGGSLAVSAAIPFLESLLIDMMAGVATDESTVGPVAGDAITSGAAMITQTMAQSNGMQPSDGGAAAQTYAYANRGASEENKNYEVEIAKNDIFNPYNPYSLAGRATSAILPTAVAASASTTSAISSIVSLPMTALASLAPKKALAASGDSGCGDVGYESIGIRPGGMCQINFFMTDAELSMDTYENVTWMIDSGNLDEQGAPQGEYAKFIQNCVERTETGALIPFGTLDDQTNITNGSECIDSNSNVMPNISHFRVYTMDVNINSSMDYESDESVPVASPDTNPDEETVEESDTIVSSGEWTRPIKSGGGIFISSRFMTPARPTHNGVDFAAPMNTPYYAAADGVVTKIELRRAPGAKKATQYIVVNHGGGVRTEYGHSYPDQIKVKVGDTVKAGQVISTVGNQGNIMSSRGSPTRSNGFGAHLHFNYVKNGKTVNPETAMREHGITL